MLDSLDKQGKEALDPLTEKEQQFVRVVSLMDLERPMSGNGKIWKGKGDGQKAPVKTGMK